MILFPVQILHNVGLKLKCTTLAVAQNWPFAAMSQKLYSCQ